ncbi:MAG: fluoride efflux transporter CrcB [Thermoanaerobaculia bacterium]
MRALALVFLGGGIGASLRHLFGGVVQSLARSATFPWGTFVVNVTGCFVIGLLAQLSESRGVPAGGARTFVFVGVLGGYTTFSSFGNETLNLLRGGEALAAAANAGGQLVLGLLAVALGRAAAQLVWR